MKEKVSVQIQYLELDKLQRFPNNPRTITGKSLDDLCLSIQEDPLYFETRPIICSNRTGNHVIIAGEKRYLAALKLEMKTAPVAVIPGLSEEDEIRILFKDNGNFGEWDWDLAEEFGFTDLPFDKWGVTSDFNSPISEEFSNEFSEDPEIKEHNVIILRIGEFSDKVPVERYAKWLEKMQKEHDFDKNAILKTIYSKLEL